MMKAKVVAERWCIDRADWLAGFSPKCCLDLFNFSPLCVFDCFQESGNDESKSGGGEDGA